MVNVLRPEFQQSLLSLSQLNVEFWHRTLLLSASGAESFGQRLSRLQTQCGGKALDGFLSLTHWDSGSKVSDDLEEVIYGCCDLYREEVRNTEQVALITYEEMQVWLDSFLKEWRTLANSTLN